MNAWVVVVVMWIFMACVFAVLFWHDRKLIKRDLLWLSQKLRDWRAKGS